MKLKTPSILDVRSTIQCSAFHYNDVEYPINKKALMIRRTLNVHIKDDDLERYFHIKCHINNNVCRMIIDNLTCVNVASIALVRKINMNNINI